MTLMFQERSRPHQFLSAILWTAAVTASLVSAAIAGMTTMMALSLDWGESVMAGTEPWIAALVAGGEFLGIVVACVVGMTLWHTRRLKVAALVLLVCAALATTWIAIRFIAEYT